MAIPPDVSTCTACMSEVLDPADRRFGYPFTCCTDCGPRYTVVRELPYDREATSLADFAMCEHCEAEYCDPAGRRFHAQANCCADCGPALGISVVSSEFAPLASDRAPLDAAIEMLIGGAIVAVKGLGGYQLLCRADSSPAVQQLRERKHRDEKPFAVLVGSPTEAQELAELDELSLGALVSSESPIVLARAKVAVQSVIASEVGPGTGLLGLMLPTTALHVLLSAGVGVPLVCTSGNRSSEPIVIADDQASAALNSIADALLGHNRTIERRADDSVGHVVGGQFQLLRRARGFAPRVVRLAASGAPVLGVGAELKSTVCLASGRDAGVSVHLGDLESPATLQAFETSIADQLNLAGVAPELVVHDLHPEYLSTKFALAQSLAPTLAVQHHHAHLVSCLVDNGFEGPAIGVTFDGIGWGADNTLWGGEFLVGDAGGYERVAHLKPVPLPGGSAAIKSPWRMALAHLNSAFAELPDVALLARNDALVEMVRGLCDRPETMVTSSVGRLFDAVAALCGVRDTVSYEGQAAIGLEELAATASRSASRYQWVEEELELGGIDAGGLIREIVDDLQSGTAAAVVARRFHVTLAQLVAQTCVRIRDRQGLETVALTGGVFQNRLLVELALELLGDAGFVTLVHSQVPPNDGGISLGQVAIGRAHLRG